MLEAYKELNIYHKCAVLAGLLLCITSLALIPLYFFGYMNIPLGIILGAGYAIIIDVIFGIYENHRKEDYKWAVVISITRFILFAILLVLVALCYYKWDIKIFNIFAVTGGYLTSQVIFVILAAINKRKEEE